MASSSGDGSSADDRGPTAVLPPPPSTATEPVPPWLIDWGVSAAVLSSALGAAVAAVTPRGDPLLLPQSAVAVVDVTFVDDAADSSSSSGRPPVALLVKHADVGALRAVVVKSEAKWAVTVRSYDNEAAFMNHGGALIAAAGDRGCVIPRPVATASVAPGTMAGRYTTCLTYLPPPRWYERVVLDVPHTAALLRALAGFHAAAWRVGDDVPATHCTAPLRHRLFPAGGWWRAPLRPSVDFSRAPAALAHMVTTFPAHFAGLDTPASSAGMTWLADHVPLLSAWLSAPCPVGTLVHGDPKASNVLFCAGSSAGDDGRGGDTALSAALVDFQWCGGARSGAADVVYVLVGALTSEALLRGHAPALVEGYWRALVSGLHPSAAAAYPWAAFVRDMNLELLDYAKTALPQLHFDMTPAAIAVNAGSPGWLVHETCPAAAAWMFAAVLRVVAALAPTAPATPADLDAALSMPPFWVLPPHP